MTALFLLAHLSLTVTQELIECNPCFTDKEIAAQKNEITCLLSCR